MSKIFDQLRPVISALDKRVKTNLEAYPTDTAEGSIASFSDGADAPVKSLVVGINPVQDLHGYSSPWPAGGGTNLWNEQWEHGTIGGSNGDELTSATKMRSVGFIPVSPNTEYRYICNAGSGIVFYYSLDKTFLSNYSIPGARVFTTPENCYFLRFTPASTYGNTYNHDIAIVLNSTGVTTYSPYSNICPISGWTGANITTCGKNVLMNTVTSRTSNGVTYVTNTDGSITANGTATGGNGRCDIINITNPSKALLDMFSGKKLVGCPEGGGYSTYITQLVIDGTVICRDMGTGAQIPDLSQYYGASNLYIDASVRTNYAAENLVFKPMISEDASYGTYEPYSGDSIAVAFPSEAGTVYGGTLDVTNGVLTVDKAIVNLGSLTWYALQVAGENIFQVQYLLFPTGTEGEPSKAWCEVLKTMPYGRNASYLTYDNILWPSINGSFLARCSKYTDVALFKEAMNGVNLVYPMKVPQTFQLTPTEVKSMFGINNIYADCGNVSVEYRADTTTYINRKIAEAISALS